MDRHPLPLEDLSERLRALRAREPRRAPVARLLQIEALIQRAGGQSAAVQAVLRQRAEVAITELEQAVQTAPDLDEAEGRLAAGARGSAPALVWPGRPVVVARPSASDRSSALLRTPPSAQAASPSRAPASPAQTEPAELASVARFRRAWQIDRARERVSQARAQAPANAGPLNSQMLVLRSLELMQALPGDYLRHFMAQVEALVWLEANRPVAREAEARPARKSARKPRATASRDEPISDR